MACIYIHHIGILPARNMRDTSAEVEAALFPSTADCTGDVAAAQRGGERIGSRRQYHLEPFGLGGRLWRRSERSWKRHRVRRYDPRHGTRAEFVSH